MWKTMKLDTYFTLSHNHSKPVKDLHVRSETKNHLKEVNMGKT